MNQEDRELGVCCAEFYNHPLVVKLLDGIFHPGGLALSRLMVDKMGLDKDRDLPCQESWSSCIWNRC
jgi:hypothetical protein